MPVCCDALLTRGIAGSERLWMANPLRCPHRRLQSGDVDSQHFYEASLDPTNDRVRVRPAPSARGCDHAGEAKGLQRGSRPSVGRAWRHWHGHVRRGGDVARARPRADAAGDLGGCARLILERRPLDRHVPCRLLLHRHLPPRCRTRHGRRGCGLWYRVLAAGTGATLSRRRSGTSFRIRRGEPGCVGPLRQSRNRLVVSLSELLAHPRTRPKILRIARGGGNNGASSGTRI